ncbi:MAG: IS4 family transposase [Gammaproteobacteria bacterium]|nr:MAG: IS4 family transposase [Gammaproteobacteria bacterium]
MGKGIFFTGQPILSQLLCFIPRSMVQRIAHELKSDRYVKHFGAYEHLVTMLYAVLNRCTSLREVVTGMQASCGRLQHLGLSCTPRRSTLADANGRRDAAFFERLYHGLYQLHYGGLPDSLPKKGILERLFIIDSTTITLFSDVLQGAGCYGNKGCKKGGVKAHVCARALHDAAAFVVLSEAARHDTLILDKMALPTGSIVVFDKGYRNYKQLLEWSRQDVTWVTRLSKGTVYEVAEEKELSDAARSAGVLSDQNIILGNPATEKKTPLQRARLITYYDAEKDRTFEFITNNRRMAPLTICGIYRQRWQIELLFKRIKQAFQLHFFMGDSENAIYVQLWCTLIADLLLKIVKDRLKKVGVQWSMANITSLVRLHLTTYIDLFAFLRQPEKALLGYEDHYHKEQLLLFAT